MKYCYTAIEKTETQDDGTIKVYGVASSAAIDSDGEIITSNAMKAALPDYMKWANIRVMHSSTVAGVALDACVQDDGKTYLAAHIIDPHSVKMVQGGAYKGFSVGGRVTSRATDDLSVITGFELIEISLVDRPANPEAIFTMFKADITSALKAQLSALTERLDTLERASVKPVIIETIEKAITMEKTAEIQEPTVEAVASDAGADETSKAILTALLSLKADNADLIKRLAALEKTPVDGGPVLKAAAVSKDDEFVENFSGWSPQRAHAAYFAS